MIRPGDGFLALALVAAVLVVPVYAEQQAEETLQAETQALPEVQPVQPELIWDAQAGQWVELKTAGKRSEYLQVPLAQPLAPSGLNVLDRRFQAVREHWEYVLWLRDRGLL